MFLLEPNYISTILAKLYPVIPSIARDLASQHSVSA